MKKLLAILILISITVMVFSLNQVNAESEKLKTFPDIQKHWAKDNIEQAIQKGYINGHPDGTFKPNDPVTAGQLLSMMFLSISEINDSGERVWSKSFLDRVPVHAQKIFVKYHHDLSQGTPWYKNYAETAVSIGLYRDFQFEGKYSYPLTREKVAFIIDHMVGWTDAVVNKEYAKLAVANIKDSNKFSPGYEIQSASLAIRGIMNGSSDRIFNPQNFVTRAEAVALIERMNNPSLRSPMKVDLNSVPYSIVPNHGYKDDIFVFSNFEMKKVHDELVKIMPSYQGAVEHQFSSFSYYENEKLMQEQIYDKQNIDEWTGERVELYDMGIGIGTNAYSISLSAEEGRYERSSETLNKFLTLVFKDNAPKIKKIIDEQMKLQISGVKVKVDTVIANRQVIINSVPGSNIISIGISGYEDK